MLIPAGASPAAFTARVELADSREPGVRKQKDFSGVVVWLEPAGGFPGQIPSRTFTMSQKGKRFVPHILAIPLGSTVDFPNFDPIFHNAFSNFGGQPFDTGLYPPGTSRKIQFRRDGVVRVFCNIHAAMSAVIVVVKTAYVAVSSAGGAIRMDGVPPGIYQMRVWHERASGETLRALERRVEVPEAGTASPVVLRISEAGYLAAPHKNKYGHDYPPETGDAAYPGARK